MKLELTEPDRFLRHLPDAAGVLIAHPLSRLDPLRSRRPPAFT